MATLRVMGMANSIYKQVSNYTKKYPTSRDLFAGSSNIIIDSAHKARNVVSGGFGLIEVLVALAIVSIALIALIFSMNQSIRATQAIQDKLIGHWLGLESLNATKLGLINPMDNIPLNKQIKFMGETWYIKIMKSPISNTNLNSISVSSSHKPSGPFHDSLSSIQAK